MHSKDDWQVNDRTVVLLELVMEKLLFVPLRPKSVFSIDLIVFHLFAIISECKKFLS